MLGSIVSFELLEGARLPMAGRVPVDVPQGRRRRARRRRLARPRPVLWWFGDYQSFLYRDDAMGGVEADCLLELEMRDGARAASS